MCRDRIDIAAAPAGDHALAVTIVLTGINKKYQKHDLTLPVGQSGEDLIVFSDRFQAGHRLRTRARTLRQEPLNSKIKIFSRWRRKENVNKPRPEIYELRLGHIARSKKSAQVVIGAWIHMIL